MRVESDLTGGGATIFTSPEEIKFEMATIVEVLEDNTGKLTQNQFSVQSLSDDEKYIYYCQGTVLHSQKAAIGSLINDESEITAGRGILDQ